MSVPHTGQLTALINGHTYRFDGDQWTGPVPAIVQSLQAARTFVPITHLDIREIAEQCADIAGIPMVIQTVEFSIWGTDDDLAEDAID